MWEGREGRGIGVLVKFHILAFMRQIILNPKLSSFFVIMFKILQPKTLKRGWILHMNSIAWPAAPLVSVLPDIQMFPNFYQCEWKVYTLAKAGSIMFIGGQAKKAIDNNDLRHSCLLGSRFVHGAQWSFWLKMWSWIRVF